MRSLASLAVRLLTPQTQTHIRSYVCIYIHPTKGKRSNRHASFCSGGVRLSVYFVGRSPWLLSESRRPNAKKSISIRVHRSAHGSLCMHKNIFFTRGKIMYQLEFVIKFICFASCTKKCHISYGWALQAYSAASCFVSKMQTGCALLASAGVCVHITLCTVYIT